MFEKLKTVLLPNAVKSLSPKIAAGELVSWYKTQGWSAYSIIPYSRENWIVFAENRSKRAVNVHIVKTGMTAVDFSVSEIRGVIEYLHSNYMDFNSTCPILSAVFPDAEMHYVYTDNYSPANDITLRYNMAASYKNGLCHLGPRDMTLPESYRFGKCTFLPMPDENSISSAADDVANDLKTANISYVYAVPHEIGTNLLTSTFNGKIAGKIMDSEDCYLLGVFYKMHGFDRAETIERLNHMINSNRRTIRKFAELVHRPRSL